MSISSAQNAVDPNKAWRSQSSDYRLSASGRTYVSIDPSTGRRLADVPDCDEADVEAVVAIAQNASRDWRRLMPKERAQFVRRAAQIMVGAREELAQLDAVDGGNPVSAMRSDVDKAAEYMELMADYSSMLGGETVRASKNGLHYTEREAYGVVLRIIPFNHPVMFAGQKIAAPLVAGNAVVLKVAHQTPLSALRLGELWKDVFPPGVLTVLTGSGPAIGQAAVRHRGIRRIAFTGSDVTGRAILRDAAESAVKYVTLELGGKNAMVVFEDADLDALSSHLVNGMNLRSSTGQSCGSTSRILVHKSLFDEVLARTATAYADLRVGSPLDEQVDVGPVVSQIQLDKVTSLVDAARSDGALVAQGGSRVMADGLSEGYFYSPTVLYGMDRASRVAQEEIFGPVVSLMPFDSEADAISAANNTRYGLTASVWTQDLTIAHRVSRQLEAGYVWVNGTSEHFLGTPFGGFKDSGIGREESLEELLSFTQTRVTHIMVPEC